MSCSVLGMEGKEQCVIHRTRVNWANRPPWHSHDYLARTIYLTGLVISDLKEANDLDVILPEANWWTSQ